jgi:hypothetical protein
MASHWGQEQRICRRLEVPHVRHAKIPGEGIFYRGFFLGCLTVVLNTADQNELPVL